MSFNAKITEITSFEDISQIKAQADFGEICAICLEISPDLKVGDSANFDFKSSDVIISLKKPEDISVQNIFEATICEIKIGKVTANVILQNKNFKFSSLISSSSAKRLNLKTGTKVFALIKSTVIFIND